MDIQRLRNLTTGRLHTNMGDIYLDIEFITGEKGVMTHMLPNAMRAIEPWLKTQIADPRMWEDEYDTTHTGEIDLRPMNDDERKEFWARYTKLPSPLERKRVLVVEVEAQD